MTLVDSVKVLKQTVGLGFNTEEGSGLPHFFFNDLVFAYLLSASIPNRVHCYLTQGLVNIDEAQEFGLLK